MSSILQAGDVSTETYSRVPCANCGLVFFLPTDFDRRLREEGRGFYCPAGHNLSYGGSEVDRLRKQVANLEQRTSSLSQSLDFQKRVSRDNEARRIAQKAATNRLKNRIKGGACPCCSKRFEDVAAHMNAEHPGFAEKR
jgi:hypothetical protein